MTVGELIDFLKGLPQDSEVEIETADPAYGGTFSSENISVDAQTGHVIIGPL